MWFWNKALSQSTHTLPLFTWAMGTCICTSPVSVSAASSKYIQICIQPYDQICLLISCAALQGLPTGVWQTNLGLGCRYSVKFMLSIYCLIYTFQFVSFIRMLLQSPCHVAAKKHSKTELHLCWFYFPCGRDEVLRHRAKARQGQTECVAALGTDPGSSHSQFSQPKAGQPFLWGSRSQSIRHDLDKRGCKPNRISIAKAWSRADKQGAQSKSLGIAILVACSYDNAFQTSSTLISILNRHCNNIILLYYYIWRLVLWCLSFSFLSICNAWRKCKALLTLG